MSAPTHSLGNFIELTYMQLSFATERLRRALLNPDVADWSTSEELEDVQAVLADLIAASNLLEVPVGLPDLTNLDVEGFEISAGTKTVIECRLDHVRVRQTNQGQPDWEWIQRLMISGLRKVEP